MKKAVQKIFDDLDKYREWTKKHGFRFNEADLYQRRGPWSLMERERTQGLVIENQWDKGARIFRRNIIAKVN